MFGASGIVFTNVTSGFTSCAKQHQAQATAIEERLAFAAPINSAMAQWTAKLSPSDVRMTQLVTTGVQIAGGTRPGADAHSLVVSMSEDLAVAVFRPLGTDGQVNASHAPPLLLVLDTRTDGDDDGSRVVNLTVSTAVLSWTPFVGDVQKGFADCAKSVLGNEPVLPLRRGEAVLLGLTMLAPGAGTTKATPQGLWASGRRRKRT